MHTGQTGLRSARLALVRGALVAAGVAASTLPASARSQDAHAYRSVPLGSLELTEGSLDAREVAPWSSLGSLPRVWLDGPGEAYVALPDPATWANRRAPLRDLVLALRLPAAGATAGTLVVPGHGEAVPARYTFRLEASDAGAVARTSFLEARLLFYARLLSFDVPGAAWFRHRADATRAELAELGVYPVLAPAAPRSSRRRRPSDLQDSYDVLTGGRALAENLALDSVLEPEEDYQWVSIDELTGITTREMEWERLVRGIEPSLDPLARLIPSDQHAAFFPSFRAFTRVLDEARTGGAPVIELFEASLESARTQQRYERQLCLRLDATARLLGDAVVASVAVTGGDPYLRTGSDVALVFETRTPGVLHQHVLAQHAAALAADGVQEVGGRVGGRAYTGVRAPDRSIHSLVLAADGVVVVSNSRVQLEHITRLMDDDASALVHLDEYRFFRDRYPRGDPEETAFVVVTDATIRRWCSPKWRIGASRRTRAAAVLADRTAWVVGEHGAGREVDPGLASVPELRVPGGGAVLGDADGVRSEVYGTPTFLTPISELEIDAVTLSERDAYGEFRERYQRRWRRFFDPIAGRVTIAKGRLALDLSVLPVVDGSAYRDLMEFTGPTRLGAQTGDRHDAALMQMVMAIDPKSWLMGYVASAATKEDPTFTRPLSWLGSGFSVYLDPDPILAEVAAADDPQELLRERWNELPVGVYIESTDERALARFLAIVQKLATEEQPECTFETREHAGHAYVAYTDDDDSNLHPFYAVHADGLTVSMHEGVVQRAIERRVAAANSETGVPLGESLLVTVGADATDLLRAWWRERHGRELQRVAWGALPILDEWQRLFPDEDPLAVHERWFGVRLICPVGTGFEWDAEWGTWSSQTYGHPSAPRASSRLSPALESLRGLGFGLSFEHDGVRARAELER
ncbi:MAG: hypothetical protein GY711_27055 [bacterium]|nr:hypothetical protein [bacterium]